MSLAFSSSSSALQAGVLEWVVEIENLWPVCELSTRRIGLVEGDVARLKPQQMIDAMLAWNDVMCCECFGMQKLVRKCRFKDCKGVVGEYCERME